MHSIRPAGPPRFGLTTGAICLVILVIGALASAVGWSLVDARQAARRQAEQQAGNIALSIQGDVARAINALDQSLQATVRSVETPGLADVDPVLRRALLFNGTAAIDGMGGMTITDEKGWMTDQSLTLQPPLINLFDRDYVQAHLANPHLGLVIGRAVRVRTTGEWELPLARRINHPDGSFAGVAEGGLTLSFFHSLFNTLQIGNGGVITLTSADGRVIARRPFREDDIGHDMSASPVFRHLPEAPSGTFDATGSVDGVDRLYVYRKADDLPLVICVGLPLSEVFADWFRKTIIVCSAMAILTAIGSILAWALWQEFQRRGYAEQAARQSAHAHMEALARLDALFANSADVMVVVRIEPAGTEPAAPGATTPRDWHWIYEAVNPGWERLHGVRAADAVGRQPRDCMPAGLADTFTGAWHKCLCEGRTVHLVYSAGLSGPKRRMDSIIAPVFSPDGQIRRLVAVGRDITDHEALEAELRRSQRMEAIGQLTAGVAHDFNNILQGILGALEILNDEAALTREGRCMIETAREAAQNGATLVHGLLSYSRKQQLNPEVVRPEQVIGQMAQLLGPLLGRDIRVETHIAPDLWPVRADRVELHNGLLNLALNARDAMPRGGTIRLRVGNAAADEPGSAGLPQGAYVRFEVADEGEGMTPEVLERAVEPFFTTKEPGKGTGLGLPMVLGFARQSGGELRIASHPGRGTTVSLWLPRASAAAGDSPASRGDGPVQPPSGRIPVMLVDDEPLALRTLALILDKAGYQPEAMQDGQQALRRLQEGEVCAMLITDQSMPGLSGSDLIKQATRLRPGLPTILITGYDRLSGLDELEGRVTVLRKPIRRAEFLRQIEALLEPMVDGRQTQQGAGRSDAPANGNVVVFRTGPLR